MTDDSRARARDRVLFQLKTRGEQTAGQLARRLGVTAVAVRQHLTSLEDEGDVSWADQRGKVGRPARVWRVTEQASARFPDTHAELTVDLLESMQTAFGEEGIDRLLAARSRKQLRDYRTHLPGPEKPLQKRVAALAAIRRAEGYMAEWSAERDGSFLLLENHCPICAAATVCQGLCREELSVFQKVLGRDVSVERSEHILAGARRCAYRITPKS